jgi:predicted fused transcriptional regulator/phosphomethylpyrimidine kinase
MRPIIFGMTGAEQERSEVIARLSEAAGQLEQSMPGQLLPAAGGNIAYAIRGARSLYDIAAVTKGFQADHGSVRCSGQVAFGVDERLARTILTVIKFDPAVRSAASIRFSDDSLQILSDMFLECAETRDVNPPGSSSQVDFAISSCCSKGVPDVVAVHGSSPETSVIWLFDEGPVRLASNIIILSNRIR